MMSERSVFQIKVTLKHIAPPVWRRIQIESDTPLDDLHAILQLTMGWTDSHLHAFRVGRESYGMPDDEFPMGMRDETGVPLDTIIGPGKTMIYEYDFGDGWEHLLKVEEDLAPEEGIDYPRCVAGARACPPEDSGGFPGYARLLATLADPEHEEYEEFREWAGEDFDPEDFDPDTVNALLTGTDAPGATAPLEPMPDYTDTELAAFDEEELLNLLVRFGNRVPRRWIDACAARGDAIVEALAGRMDNPSFLDPDDDGEWFLWLHAAMVLGLVPVVGAGRLLITLMRRFSELNDHDIQDALAGYWPALFFNKPRECAAELRAFAEDKECPWYVRFNAAETYVSMQDESRLDAALDWIAERAADDDEDLDFRLCCGDLLIAFPRPRHRALLKSLVNLQHQFTLHFKGSDVTQAMRRGKDEPEWERFTNPWAIYDPENIAARQQPRADADDDDDDRDDASDTANVVAFPSDPAYFVRSQPKTGRNDPCPCGSGKKYKKCCLEKGG